MIGTGWPNGPVSHGNDHILALPGPLLMLSSEHWHVTEAQASRKKVLYRIVPPPGKRPAELGWNVNSYTRMILDELHGLNVTDLVWANELDLNYERGDNEDDFQNLPGRYSTIAAFATRLVGTLHNILPNTRIHWPAFTPSKDHLCMDYVYLWREAALLHDVVDFHAYDNLENIQSEHTLYAQQFPTKSLALTEFHARGNIKEEKQIFTYLLEQNLESYFFIYEWFNPSEWWSEAFDIAHNPDRYDLIMNQHTLLESEPDPMPTDPNANRPQWIAFAEDGCGMRGIPFEDMYKPQIQLESGWNHYRADGSIVTSPTGSKGLGQLNSRFYPPETWTDPLTNLTTSMDLMKQYHTRYGSWKKALAAYNWGPSNVAGYTKDGLTHPAWDGTRNWRCPHEPVVASCRVGQMHHYLDVILGTNWEEPTSDSKPTEPTMPQFNFGFKDLADQLGPAVVGTPLTDEIYPNPDYSYQLTTTGKMEYYKSVNKTYFFRAAQK